MGPDSTRKNPSEAEGNPQRRKAGRVSLEVRLRKMIEELYAQYNKELLYWLKGMSGNDQTAEDILQETFLRAMLNEEILTGLKAPQRRAWLYRTAKNLYIDRFRRRAFETVTDEIMDTPHEDEAASMIEWEELLSGLPEDERMIFVMRYLEGYNSTQIGELFQMPPGTVRSKLSSARNALREMMR